MADPPFHAFDAALRGDEAAELVLTAQLAGFESRRRRDCIECGTAFIDVSSPGGGRPRSKLRVDTTRAVYRPDESGEVRALDAEDAAVLDGYVDRGVLYRL